MKKQTSDKNAVSGQPSSQEASRTWTAAKRAAGESLLQSEECTTLQADIDRCSIPTGTASKPI